MKAFGRFLLLAVAAFSTFSISLASASSTACFDITAELKSNITHIFVATEPAASPSDYAITVDGEPIEKLYTDESPCEDIPRDVWFPLHGSQDTAHVCVSVQGAGPHNIEVSAKIDNECITSTTPLVSIEPVN